MKIFTRSINASDKRQTPSNFGKTERNFNEQRLNLLPIIRDCVSNFCNYPPPEGVAKKMACGQIGFDTGPLAGKQFLWVAHNGKPFKDLEEILQFGVQPGVSKGSEEGTRAEVYGSGLCYGAALIDEYGRAVLGIASKTEDGNWIAGAGQPRKTVTDGNKWIVESAPEIVEAMTEHFDEKTILSQFNVVYFFGMPFQGENFNSKLHNLTIQVMTIFSQLCGSMLDDVDFRFVESLFIPDHEWKDKSPNPHVMVLNNANMGRPVISKEAYEKAYANNVEPIVLEVPEFSHTFGTTQDTFYGSAKVKIHCFDYNRTDTDQWMLTVRDNQGDDKPFPHLKSFEKGKQWGSGGKPSHQGFLTIDAFDGACSAYGRYKSQPVGITDSLKALLEAFNMWGYKGCQQNYLLPDGSKPFMIVECVVTEITHKTDKDGVPYADENIAIDFIDTLGRRPDHMTKHDYTFGLMKSICRAAIINRKDEAVEALYKWYSEKFPNDAASLTPISDGSGGAERAARFDVYNILDDGEPFDRKLSLGFDDKKAVLAIKDVASGKFVEKIDVADGVRGLTIDCYNIEVDKHNFEKWLGTKPALREKVRAFREKNPDTNVPFFVVNVHEEITHLDISSGKSKRFVKRGGHYDHAAAYAAYEAAVNGVGDNPLNFTPSRQMKGKVELGSGKIVSISFGMVQDVPKPPKREGTILDPEPTEPSVSTGIKKKKKGNLPNLEPRHKSVPVRFTEGRMILNQEYEVDGHKPLAIFLNPDSVGTKTQKIAQAIYNRMFANARGVHDAVNRFTVSKFENVLDALPHKNMDENGEPIYDKNDPTDFAVNCGLDSMFRNEGGDEGLMALYHKYQSIHKSTPEVPSVVVEPVEAVS